jgi:TAG lipase/steryl ester hydrolase/phospholipase A2/LPA acyltransferase
MRALFSNFSSRSRLIGQLQQQQQVSESQDEWMDLAERIDSIQGNDVWRSDPKCALYEQKRISHRIDEYVHLMRRNDIFELMFTLRGGIHRNKFGLLHEGLFSKAIAGSKVLVETYHNVVCAALDFVCDAPVPPGEAPIPTEARLAFFNETRHMYGRTALLLSGGAALGFYHVGVVKCLMQNGLMPRVMGGASAGSIVSAMIGTRTDDECLNDMFEAQGTIAPGHSGEIRLDFFSPIKGPDEHDDSVLKNSAGGFRDAKRTWQLLFPIGLRRVTSTIYDVLTGNQRPQDMLNHDTEHFRNCLRTNIGNFTFQEAFDRTGRILNIIVTPNNTSDPPRLLNYLTAPHVMVWSAAVASSSLPGVFEANKLTVKDADGTERYESAEPTHFSDGSMEADLPMAQLSEMFNVNHFIISQANPHAVMFASFGLSKAVWTTPILGIMTQVLMFLKNQTKAWFKHCVELAGGRRIVPLFDTRRELWSSFFTQEYEGRPTDISLIPWINHRGFFSALAHCIYNPDREEFVEWGKEAERETWKYIPAIKSHIAEEVTLDRCVQRLRKRMLLESWEKRRQGKAVSSGQNFGDRVPSFFTSPSLVNMSGLGVADVPNLSAEDSAQTAYDEMRRSSENSDEDDAYAHQGLLPVNDDELQNGWGGMGLRGNHSSGSLNRSNSGASGLFLMDDEDGHYQQQQTDQVAGEKTLSPRNNKGGLSNNPSLKELENRYVKTSSMAHFYYRKTGGSVEDFLMRHSKSHGQIAKEAAAAMSSIGSSQSGLAARHERKRSKSAVDLGKTISSSSLPPPPS